MGEPNLPRRVLVVDDNDIDRERIRRLLGPGFDLSEAATAAQGMDIVACNPNMDCVLLDHRLPDQDGIDALKGLVQRGLPVLMLTAKGSESLAVEAMRRGAQDYLNKADIERDQLQRAIGHAMERAELQRQLARQRADLEAAHRALAEREAQLQLFMTQLPGLAWTTDSALVVTSATGSAFRAHAMDAHELVGQDLSAMLAKVDDAAAARAAHDRALGGEVIQYELRWDRHVFECRLQPLRGEDGAISGVIGVGIDVTQTRSLEQQFRQAQKMDAIGKLAGGVAHDFNNILMAILSFGGFAQEALEPGSQAHQDIEEVMRAADRAKSLVAKLLMFSRQRAVEPRAINVNDLIAMMVPMLRRLLGADVVLDIDAGAELWTTLIDPGGLEQVIVNLAVNARDAMPRGGRFVLQTRNMISDGAMQVSHSRMPPAGEYIVISASDEGTGIPREIMERIFEPFFTTKEVGRGTGLGLSTCYGIVQQAKGTLSVYSEVGHGTTFRAYLPRFDAAPSVQPPREQAQPPEGAETILVVEDEDSVRAVVVRTLQRLGYAVLEASGAEAAKRLCERHSGEIHLVLSDVVMPHANGQVVAALVKEMCPRVKVLYMSGYADRAVRQRDLVAEGDPLIEKPFSVDALARTVRDVLDGSKGSVAPGRVEPDVHVTWPAGPMVLSQTSSRSG